MKNQSKRTWLKMDQVMAMCPLSPIRRALELDISDIHPQLPVISGKPFIKEMLGGPAGTMHMCNSSAWYHLLSLSVTDCAEIPVISTMERCSPANLWR
jgi:hypothetical protein